MSKSRVPGRTGRVAVRGGGFLPAAARSRDQQTRGCLLAGPVGPMLLRLLSDEDGQDAKQHPNADDDSRLADHAGPSRHVMDSPPSLDAGFLRPDRHGFRRRLPHLPDAALPPQSRSHSSQVRWCLLAPTSVLYIHLGMSRGGRVFSPNRGPRQTGRFRRGGPYATRQPSTDMSQPTQPDKKFRHRSCGLASLPVYFSLTWRNQ